MTKEESVQGKKKWSKKRKIITVVVILAIAASIMPIKTYTDEAFHAGNTDEYSVENTPALEKSLLKGKNIIFLGSSVTYGSAAKGESFVDYLVKRDGIVATKEAVSGTLLVDEEVWGKKSYIERMKSIDTSIDADAFVCQLSTNDASMKKPLGEISTSTNLDDFDTQTVAGAIEYVIVYARQTWDCPVVFYTGTKYNSEQYGQMVELLLQIKDKWDIEVIDLWNDADMNAVSDADYKLYMVNGIHPSRAGYRDWWTPKFEEALTKLLV